MPEEIRIVLDRDCPQCGWPELVAVGESIEAGPKRVECNARPSCGWSEPVLLGGN